MIEPTGQTITTKRSKLRALADGVGLAVSVGILLLGLFTIPSAVRQLEALNKNTNELEKVVSTLSDNTDVLSTNTLVLGANSAALQEATEDLVINTEQLAHNTESSKESTDALESTVDRLSKNTKSIIDNTSSMQASIRELATVSGALSKNTEGLVGNTGSVHESVRRLTAVAGELSDNTDSLSRNTDSLSGNTKHLNDATDELTENTESIVENTGRLVELTEVAKEYGLLFPLEPGQTDPPENDTSPTVTISHGTRGPTELLNGQGTPCGTESSRCFFVAVDLENYQPGDYRVECHHDGWGGLGYETWASFMISVGANGSASQVGPCFINFARLTHNGVKVVVHAPNGTITQSDWLR